MNIEDYLKNRLRELSVMLANYEDSLEICEECEKEKLNILIEMGRAKIDELKKLKKEMGFV